MEALMSPKNISINFSEDTEYGIMEASLSHATLMDYPPSLGDDVNLSDMILMSVRFHSVFCLAVRKYNESKRITAFHIDGEYDEDEIDEIFGKKNLSIM